jgi:signal transduction histidine kinase
VARLYATLADSTGRRVGVVVDSTAPVRGDAAQLERALGNLVHNALIHGEGEVTLRARVQDGWLELRVEDEGPGVVPESVTASVGEAPPPRPGSSRPAHGLGLTIVRRVAEAHGGALQVFEARDGMAGTVSLRLPLHEA